MMEKIIVCLNLIILYFLGKKWESEEKNTTNYLFFHLFSLPFQTASDSFCCF